MSLVFCLRYAVNYSLGIMCYHISLLYFHDNTNCFHIGSVVQKLVFSIVSKSENFELRKLLYETWYQHHQIYYFQKVFGLIVHRLHNIKSQKVAFILFTIQISISWDILNFGHKAIFIKFNTIWRKYANKRQCKLLESTLHHSNICITTLKIMIVGDGLYLFTDSKCL